MNHSSIPKKKIIVIGAGFGGLAAACFLAKDGHDVTVLEKNATAGGRARTWSKSGFKFDMGPSWYLMPDAFENFFAQFGKKPEDYYQLKRLDPSYSIYFAPNDKIDISADLQKNIELFESVEQGAGQKLQAYLKQAKYMYEASMDFFLYKDYQTAVCTSPISSDTNLVSYSVTSGRLERKLLRRHF